MEQPSKDKKKPNGTPVAGTSSSTTDVELTDREYSRLKNEKAELKKPENQPHIEAVYGVKREGGKDGEFKAKKYEKVYIKGDRNKGVKSKVVDGSGKVIREEIADSDGDTRMSKEYNRQKNYTEERRGNSEDYLNYKDSGKKGQAEARKVDTQKYRDTQQADIKDRQTMAQAELARDKEKKGGY